MKKNDIALRYIQTIAKPKLAKYGVEVNLDLNSGIVYSGGIGCSGYFDDTEKVIAVGVGTKKTEDWFGTFLHEFSHFEQWVEKCKAWTDSQPKDQSSDEWLDAYLEGKDVPNIEQILRSICYLEYDCEIRTSDKLIEFPEIFDVGLYIQKANAYIAFYKQVLYQKTWYDPKQAPYLNPDIYMGMPPTFFPFEVYFDKYDFYYIPWQECLPKKEISK